MKIGTTDISDLTIGTTDINSVYLGTTEIWTRSTGTPFNLIAIGGGSGDPIELSYDYGSNWTTKTNPSGSFVASFIDFSDDGKYIIITDSTNTSYPIWSTDYGASWSTLSAVAAAKYTGCAISSDGQYMSICAPASYAIYETSNYGSSWTLRSTSSKAIGVMDISSDGGYLIGGDSKNATGSAWYSTDMGANWSTWSGGISAQTVISLAIDGGAGEAYTGQGGSQYQKDLSFPGTRSATTLSGSSGVFVNTMPTGQNVLVKDSTGAVYMSSDYGANFSALTTPTWNTVSSPQNSNRNLSVNGSRILFGDSSGTLLYNNGLSWSYITNLTTTSAINCCGIL